MKGLITIVALAAAAPAFAQQDAPQVQRHLESVVVTASSQEERVGDLPVTIQTFDSTEIRQSAATTVTDFLAERGVAFFSVWSPAQTSINIRGGATDGGGRDFRSQVVVLINGRRAGTANISKLALHDVQRIEVLRGPGSLVYGSQALGGVINLITRDGLRDRGAYLRVNGGSWGLLDALAQYGAMRGRWDYFVSAHGGRRGDYHAGADAIEQPQRNTAYQQGGGMFVLGYTPDAFQRLTFTARSDGMYDTGFRGSSWDWDNVEDRTNLSTDLAYGGRTSSGRTSWDVQTSFFRDIDDFRHGAEVMRLASGLPGPGVDRDHSIRRQNGVVMRGSVTLQPRPANALQLGTDAEWTQLRNSRSRTALPGLTTTQIAPPDNNSNSRNTGLFVEDVHRMLGDRLILRGGVRADLGQHEIRATPNAPLLRERSETYDAFTYRVGATVKPAPAAAIRFNVGTGYRAPTPTELAVDFTTVLGNQIVGNPDLTPERATSVEVGAAIERNRVWVDVALFRNDITDRIATVPEAPGSSRFVFVNRDESDIVGLELQSRVDIATLGAGATFWAGANGVYHFRMRDLDAARRGLNSDRIQRMYESQGSVLVGVTSPQWTGRLVGTYYGDVWYETEENLLIPFGEPHRTFVHQKSPFWAWNLQGKREIGGGLWVAAAIQNLLNKNEHPLFIAVNRAPLVADTALSNGGVGNSMPGRAFVVGFEYRP
jgi:vitamin B12 transporter